MFSIYPVRSNETIPVLPYDRNVFKMALSLGYNHCLIHNENGTDFEIEYTKNNDFVPEKYRNNKKGIDIYPSYFDYDEENISELDLTLLENHRIIYFKELNEYSVVLARLALRYTNAEVFFKDPFASQFFECNQKIFISPVVPVCNPNEILLVEEEFVSGTLEQNFHIMSTLPVFHSVFFWQSLTNRKKSNVKYVEIAVSKNVGIGGVLSYYTNAKHVFEKRNWETFLKRGASRYPDDMLAKYFCLSYLPEDATEENTIYLEDVIPITMTYYYAKNTSEINDNIFNSTFKCDMEEYADAVVGNRRSLGVLIRGTDYILTNMGGARKMATVDEMLPVINQWLSEDKYDCIFLATEDQDILEQMRTVFGSKVIAIAQERHRISDFIGVKLLSEMEQLENNPDAVEDNIVNYFYALFVLSKCTSFIASGQCHGWNVVNSLNCGKFEKSMKMQVGLK